MTSRSEPAARPDAPSPDRASPVRLAPLSGEQLAAYLRVLDAAPATPFLRPLPRDAGEHVVVKFGRDRYVLAPRKRQGRSRRDLYRDGEPIHGYPFKPTPRPIEHFDKAVSGSFRATATFTNAVMLVRYTDMRSLTVYNLSVIRPTADGFTVERLADREQLVAAIEREFAIPAEMVSDAIAGLGPFGDAYRCDSDRQLTGEGIQTMPTGPVVSASALRPLLESGGDIVLLDARQERAAYDAGHLPGARHADLNEHLSGLTGPAADPARGGRHPLPTVERWRRTLGDWAITPSTTVIVYDDQAGANAAARAWWMLRSIGHERVAVLDGGLAAALAAGLPLTTAVARLSPLPSYPGHRWLRPTVDIEAVAALMRNPEWLVLDVRSAPRFAGLEETIDPVAGHIPGAGNLPFAENLAGDRFKPPEELRSLYEARLAGVAPDHLIVHCGSGVTACHTLLALEIAGMHGAALYVGSWSEWCRSARPRASASSLDSP